MKNLSIVIVSALALVLTACGGDDGSESGNAGAVNLRSKTECLKLFTYNPGYSRAQNTNDYGSVHGHDMYYTNTEDRGEMYIKTSEGNVDTYESESGDSNYECVRDVQPTYTPTAQPAPVKTYPAAQPAPVKTYPATQPAPVKTYPATQPAPVKTYPATQPAPVKTYPATQPAPVKKY